MRRKFALLGTDLLIIGSSFLLSSLLSDHAAAISWLHLPLILLVRIAVFQISGLYQAMLRFAGLPLAVAIVKATGLSSVMVAASRLFPFPGELSAGFLVMDFLITTFLVGLSRFFPRYYLESRKQGGQKRVLVYGAGMLGEEVARRLLKTKGEYLLAGFIDDNQSKVGQRIHNVPILGTRHELQKILARRRVQEVIIAISRIGGEEVRWITHECRRSGVCCRIARDFVDLLDREIDIKDVDIADLLKREPRDLDAKQIERFLRGKVILVTGAAGSIGSELVRQCLRFQPRKLLMLDQSEFGLYSLTEELRESEKFKFILMDLTGKSDVFRLIEKERPDIIFHAAAYKHVPVLEENPFAAVHNNVEGTCYLAQAAHEHQVDKFVLISTDKAVRPTSVMGATKRICELYIQNLNLRSKTEFVSVRFGNVLGSSGSVIPKFIRQINEGGPVTVTHPHVTRYFMLTQEAVLLVMQAASIGNGGEIFILNMGRPVKIAEMAEDLIYLAGKRPHEDIKIVYTGLRPGEKLYEELLIDEMEKKTQYENITIGKTTVLDWQELNSSISQLLMYARQHDPKGVFKAVQAIVPEYGQEEEVSSQLREDEFRQATALEFNKNLKKIQ
jgi:FlaA1/EpsC-like NDP-sugar epimerase